MKGFKTQSIKAALLRILPKVLPLVIFGYIGNKIGYAWRISEGADVSQKLLTFIESGVVTSFQKILPSLHPADLAAGLAGAGIIWIILRVKSMNRKKYRQGEEYGSARWGTRKDIEPYMDKQNFSNNIILTQTEYLTLGKPSAPKYARNKNILIIGGSGSGKTRFCVKPNLMQMHSSYVVTDPKGTVLVECGKMLLRGRATGQKDASGREIYEPYNIKVFNTIEFGKSMHYNPFAYISAEHREKDILKFVEVLIRNTSGSSQQSGGEDFWVKAKSCSTPRISR